MMLRHLLVRRITSGSHHGTAYVADSANNDEEKEKGKGGAEGLEQWEEVGQPSIRSGDQGVAL